MVVDSEYYDWLVNKIEGEEEFDLVLEILFNREFTWSIANDDNRAEDGIILRSIFMDEEGWNTCPKFEERCSCLEMMVALAMRIENDIMWNGIANRTSVWFWNMIDNLGLKSYMNSREINWIIDQFLDRKIFMFYPNFDPQNVEIWYQAQSELMEKYWEN